MRGTPGVVQVLDYLQGADDDGEQHWGEELPRRV